MKRLLLFVFLNAMLWPQKSIAWGFYAHQRIDRTERGAQEARLEVGMLRLEDGCPGFLMAEIGKPGAVREGFLFVNRFDVLDP